jgi:DNA primase
MARLANAARRIDTDALKRERPLADVVASYGIALRRESAGTFRALCPFHQEHTPSFWIDARDGSAEHYFCFGCTAHGDVITFVMEREGCSFVEACEQLSARGRPPVVEPSPRASPRSAGRRWEELAADSIEAQVLDFALQLYEEQLCKSRRALDYLKARGVPEELARSQRLGYADGQALLRRLQHESRAQLLPVAVELGLVLERPGADDRPVYRDFFLDRIIVPELRGGRPIWCIGRAVEDEVQRASTGQGTRAIAVATPSTDTPPPPARRPRPKYLGLPGEKPLMGLEHVSGRRGAYLVEGPFDLLAAIGWHLPAFAICGTHFPPERLPALAEALAIYGVFDPDRAGQSAAERFGPVFGSRWRPVRLPNSLDLAELASLGAPGREMFDILVGRARAAAWQRAQAL